MSKYYTIRKVPSFGSNNLCGPTKGLFSSKTSEKAVWQTAKSN